MKFNFQLWSKGLIAAAIGGSTTAAMDALTDPAVLSQPKRLGSVALSGAAVGMLAYLKTHPVGADEKAYADRHADDDTPEPKQAA